MKQPQPITLSRHACMVLASLTLLLVTACATPTKTVRDNTQLRIGGVDVLSKVPEEQLLIFVTPDDTEKFCFAPPPDAVEVGGSGLSLSYGGASVGESADLGAGILGGRSELVLLGRSMLYRTCELSLNYGLTKEEAIQLFTQTMQQITTIAGDSLSAGSSSSSVTPNVTAPSQ